MPNNFSSKNPFNIRYSSITITKFNGAESLNIIPQVMELTIHQSIFSPVIKASLAIQDYIGLMNNFPLTGEEIVKVVIEQDGGDPNSPSICSYIELNFVITSINSISFDDKARRMGYIMELASVETLVNAMTRVSHAYNTNVEDMVKQIYEEYLKPPTIPNVSLPQKQLKLFNLTTKVRQLVIPNKKPLEAVAWLGKYAIADSVSAFPTYAFFEKLDPNSPGGSTFVFKPIEYTTFRENTLSNAYLYSALENYKYVSNYELLLGEEDSELNAALKKEGSDISRIVSDLKINRRYTTLDKILSGYFENEYFEVSMLLNDHYDEYNQLEARPNPNNRGGNGPQIGLGTGRFNTPNYIDYIKDYKKDRETSPHVNYVINNFDYDNQPDIKYRYGHALRSYHALRQVDMSLAIFPNLYNGVGDIISITMPEMHGFNEQKTDEFLSGAFLVTEIKTIIRAGGVCQSYIRVNKDSFNEDVDREMLYNPEGALSSMMVGG